jgi:pimeloyl-ACP methyl ester carboxylesterase
MGGASDGIAALRPDRAMRSTDAVTNPLYDEFGLFHENAEEFGIELRERPSVERVRADTGSGGFVSALRWGTADPELVLLHGGAQNAHTWDTVALALGRPLVAIDLPGHGHSSHRDDHVYWPAENAIAIEAAVRAIAPKAKVVVGMSLGGLSALALTDRAPDVVRSLVLVDVTPGVNREKSSAIAQFIDGPEYFASFDEILERTVAFNPTRSESSLRRGILHNAIEAPDGRWRWRYDLPRRGSGEGDDGKIMPGIDDLWDAVARVRVPFLLARGSLSPVVDDDDVAEIQRRNPAAEVVVVEDAGHSIQGDKPLELARILEARL